MLYADMFIESSKDLLFVVLAFCALWLTIFLSWMMYYVISIIRDAATLVKQMRNATEKIYDFVHVAHEKLERSASSFTLVASALKELVTWAIQERMNKSKAGSKRKVA